MLLRSLGKSEEPKGSLYYVDVEVTDFIPNSGIRLVRANGRLIFELFDDIVPNVTRVFKEMVEFISENKIVYECGNNEGGFRCVWNQLDQKLDEQAMSVSASVCWSMRWLVHSASPRARLVSGSSRLVLSS